MTIKDVQAHHDSIMKWATGEYFVFEEIIGDPATKWRFVWNPIWSRMIDIKLVHVSSIKPGTTVLVSNDDKKYVKRTLIGISAIGKVRTIFASGENEWQIAIDGKLSYSQWRFMKLIEDERK